MNDLYEGQSAVSNKTATQSSRASKRAGILAAVIVAIGLALVPGSYNWYLGLGIGSNWLRLQEQHDAITNLPPSERVPIVTEMAVTPAIYMALGQFCRFAVLLACTVLLCSTGSGLWRRSIWCLFTTAAIAAWLTMGLFISDVNGFRVGGTPPLVSSGILHALVVGA